VKLAQSEADKLLAFLRRTCRPQTPDEALDHVLHVPKGMVQSIAVP
jgi:hypothetical protein